MNPDDCKYACVPPEFEDEIMFYMLAQFGIERTQAEKALEHIRANRWIPDDLDPEQPL